MDSLVKYKLITNKISIVNNNLNDGHFSVDPKIHRTIDQIDENTYSVTYDLEMKNSEQTPFPVDIEVSITGLFDVSKLGDDQIDDFIKIQTCQILFPQIRTIISSLTSVAMMTPLLLPIVDARKLFSENSSNQSE